MGPRALRVPTNHYKAEEEVSTRLGLIMIHTHSDRTQAERSQVQPTPPRGVWKRFGLEISFLENLLGGGGGSRRLSSHSAGVRQGLL